MRHLRKLTAIVLRNRQHGIAAIDFGVVPAVRFRLSYAWLVIGHGRREVIHLRGLLREHVDDYDPDRESSSGMENSVKEADAFQ